MNYTEILKNLEEFKTLVNRNNWWEDKNNYEKICMLYGSIEEVINRFGGINRVEVPADYGAKPLVYSNYVEAGYLSGRTIHTHQGYSQLLKVIGKVKELAKNPDIPRNELSITNLVQIIRRFRECCQYLKNPPMKENDVQDILWIMLRSQFERVEREEFLPTFGAKAYKPDFGIIELGVLIEVKFIGDDTKVSFIQEEILADIPGYLNSSNKYQGIIEVIYDYAQKLRDPKRFIEDLKKVEGIIEVIVVPGIGK